MAGLLRQSDQRRWAPKERVITLTPTKYHGSNRCT